MSAGKSAIFINIITSKLSVMAPNNPKQRYSSDNRGIFNGL